MTEVGVAVIGCGATGEQRARSAVADERTVLRVVVDSERQRASRLADELGVASAREWRHALDRDDVGAVVVCTPHGLLVPIAIAALRTGRHVLVEKPMGRNATEARALLSEGRRAGMVLKVGFNHRYHAGIARAHELYRRSAIGRLLLMRARYGHGPVRAEEWRGNAELAGGGELLGRGVDVVDLFQWFAGSATRAQAEVQTALQDRGRLEDNAFGILRFPGGVVGQFHVSMTQVKELFSLEVQGEDGTLAIDGLGGRSGAETLTLVSRTAGGVRSAVVPIDAAEGHAWAREWSDFAAALHGETLQHGSPEEGLQVMATVDALYAAARSGCAVTIAPPPRTPAQ